MNRKRYAIVEAVYIDMIDFSQVLQDSDQLVRYNNTNSHFVVKWEGETPQTVLDLPGYDGPYTQSEIRLIMMAVEWQRIL